MDESLDLVKNLVTQESQVILLLKYTFEMIPVLQDVPSARKPGLIWVFHHLAQLPS